MTLSSVHDLKECRFKEFDKSSLKVRVQVQSKDKVGISAIQVSFDGHYLPTMEANLTRLIHSGPQPSDWFRLVGMRLLKAIKMHTSYKQYSGPAETMQKK